MNNYLPVSSLRKSILTYVCYTSVLFFKQAWQSETSLERSVWTLLKLWFLNRKPTLLAYSNENEQSRKAVGVE